MCNGRKSSCHYLHLYYEKLFTLKLRCNVENNYVARYSPTTQISNYR